MEDEKKEEEKQGETLTPNEEQPEPEQPQEQESQTPPTPDPSPVDEEEVQEPQEKMLTQSQVNELVGTARREGRESALKELLTRYGVGDEEELNGIFGKGQTYDDLNDEFNMKENSYKMALAENALLRMKIDENRWDDVKAILGSKGYEVNAENINAMLPTHPEWTMQPDQSQTQTPQTPQAAQAAQPKLETEGVIRKFGNEMSETPQEESEEEKLRRIFGM